MTTISAGARTRAHGKAATAAAADPLPAHVSAIVVGMLLALVAVLVVDNHPMTLPGASFAEIGVARSLLDDAARVETPTGTAGVDAGVNGSAVAGTGAPVTPRTAGGRQSSGSPVRSARDLHRCFVHARRSGQDPATCRVAGS